jgi:hypothetical protein
MHSPPVPTTALMVPFQVTQDIAGGQELGEQVTRIVWQTWTRDRVFPKLLFEEQLRKRHHAPGRGRGAPSRRGPRGGGQDHLPHVRRHARGFGVAFSLDIIDVRTGERLWSMAHAGTIEAGLTEDFILFTRRNRMPTDPIYAVTSTLAMDMGGPIIKWNYGYKAPPPAGPNPPPPPPPAKATGRNL